ncbi:MAG: IPTL-CTERM sorting domain-containing protein, partial [Candidatus Competibacterales bacterium]|nr:IPTL-CTERM sorting domain-containing protein [Candidatus Competibacterales bacterium]
AVGTTNVTDGTQNWWGSASGSSGAGPGTGDSVSADVDFCPWLDAPFPVGSPVDTCDDDGDGAPDAGEDGIAEGDGNGDNIPDSEQDTVASLFSNDANCELTLSVSTGMLQQVTAVPVPVDAPVDRFRFPCQAIGFLVTDLGIGATVDLTLRIRPADATLDTLLKPDGNGVWQAVAGVAINTTQDYTDLTFSLTDGGVFDADGQADGTVTDPALPGAPRSVTPTSIPALNVWGLVLLASALGLLMERRRRRA